MGRPRVLVAVLAAGLVGALTAGLTGAPSSAAAKTRVTVSVSDATLQQGQSFVLRIRTQRAVTGQPVRVQHRTGSTWTTIRTRTLPASRRLDLPVTPPVGTQRYRVLLARKGTATAATSGTVTVVVSPLAQTAGLALATTAEVGDAVTATATFTPRRAGRTVRLQRNDAGTWTTVATQSQSQQGVASFPVPTATAGTFQYRALAAATSELAAKASPVRTLTVAEPVTWSDETVLVSHDVDGGPANAYSQSPSISDDGRFVAFDSDASDLVVDDPDNDKNDIFLWDRQTDTTVLVTRTIDGGGINNDADAPQISGNGRYVAYSSNAHDIVDVDNPLNRTAVYRWDRLTGETILVSHSPSGGIPEGGSGDMSISESGTHIAFTSNAHDLTADDFSAQVGTETHIFRWTEPSGDVVDDTILISKRPDGDPATYSSTDPYISDSGHAIAFKSLASDLDVEPGTPLTAFIGKAFVWRSTDTPRITALVDKDGGAVDEQVFVTSISGTSGRVGITYAGDDLTDEDLTAYNALVWQSAATQTVVLASHRIGETTPAALSAGDMQLSSAGATGSFRAFDALGPGDAGNDHDLFAWNDGAVSRIGLAYDGAEPNGAAGRHVLSGDGEWVAFDSLATNLVAFTTVSQQVFVTGTG